MDRFLVERIMLALMRLSVLIVLFFLGMILYFIISQGVGVLSIDFLTSMPKDGMTAGGIFPAIIGTIYLIVGSLCVSIPVGIGAAIYLVEYAKPGLTTRIIRITNNNLAGVPSVVFGLFGMLFFVNGLEFGPSILAGSLTLSLVILPLVVANTEEALRAIPNTYREASLALGASKLQTIFKVIIPMSMPRILTSAILSIGRVGGETAPILFTVAAYFLPRLPSSVFDETMALPYHLYVLSTSGTDIEKTIPIAYGTALVLLILVIVLNVIATIIRSKLDKKY